VDFFKSINDTHGHDAGDRVLQELAARIRGSIRNIDIACRTGGEEFVIILPATELDVAERIAERLRKQVGGRRFNVGIDGGLTITLSIGVAALGQQGDRADDILKRADNALYQAKREGRNRVVTSRG
jgi:two-component system, cell cycle response regulator